MNFNFVETHVFTKLDISLHIYFSFASLVYFLGPEISVWKFWPKIPLTLCIKLCGPVAPPKLFSFFVLHFLQVWFYYQNEQNEGVSQRKIPFLFLVNHPNGYSPAHKALAMLCTRLFIVCSTCCIDTLYRTCSINLESMICWCSEHFDNFENSKSRSKICCTCILKWRRSSRARGGSICERDFEAYLKMNFRPKAKKRGHWWGRYKSVSQSVLPLTFCEQILTIQTQLSLYLEKKFGGGGFLW